MDTADKLDTVLINIIASLQLKNVKVNRKEIPSDGYMTDTILVSLNELELFIKRLSRDEKHRYIFSKLLFVNEMMFYTKTVPEFEKFQRICVPKYYGCLNEEMNEIIALENLQKSGYKLYHDIKQPLDHEHIKLVLNQYGKFHSISFALKQKHPEIYAELPEIIEFLLPTLQKYRTTFTSLSKMAVANLIDNALQTEAFLNFMDNECEEFLSNVFPDDGVTALIHGDCWTTNFMFKYKDNIPIDMRLLDFQTARKGSPILDLSYFLCTSGCSKEVFENMDSYLKIYYDSVVDSLKSMNCDPDQLFPYKVLSEQWKKYAKYGLVMSLPINKIIICDKDEMVEEAEGFFDKFDFVSRHEELYKERMEILINFFYKNGFFN